LKHGHAIGAGELLLTEVEVLVDSEVLDVLVDDEVLDGLVDSELLDGLPPKSTARGGGGGGVGVPSEFWHRYVGFAATSRIPQI